MRPYHGDCLVRLPGLIVDEWLFLSLFSLLKNNVLCSNGMNHLVCEHRKKIITETEPLFKSYPRRVYVYLEITQNYKLLAASVPPFRT